MACFSDHVGKFRFRGFPHFLVLYNLYCFVWIQQVCLANMGFALDSNASIYEDVVACFDSYLEQKLVNIAIARLTNSCSRG